MSRSTTPTAPTCTTTGCDHPSPDAFLCRTCVDGLRADLLDIPDLHADLLITFARLDALDADVVPRREAGEDPQPLDEPIAETKLIYNPAAGDLLHALHGEVHGWVRHLVEQRYGADLDTWARERAARAAGAFGPWRRGPQLPADTTAELARWLARHMESVRADEAAGELRASIAHLVALARKVVLPPPLRYLGHCEHCAAAAGGGVQVEMRCERHAAHVTCPRCGTSERVEDREERLAERARGHMVTATEASRALPDLLKGVLPEGKQLTASMVRGYGLRGRLPKHHIQVRDETGAVQVQTRYKVGDLLDLARKIKSEDEAKRARRRPPAA